MRPWGRLGQEASRTHAFLFHADFFASWPAKLGAIVVVVVAIADDAVNRVDSEMLGGGSRKGQFDIGKPDFGSACDAHLET